MNETLRPLSLAEILDRTAQFYRSRFLIFLGISTIPAGTIFVFAAGAFAFFAWMGSNSRNGGSVADVFVWVFFLVLAILLAPVGLAVSALGAAALSDASARMFLGETITIRNSYKNVWRRGWRYVWLYILEGVVVVVAPLVVLCLGMIAMIAGKVRGYASGDNSPLFGGLMVLLFMILAAFAVWMLLRFCLAFPTAVVEQVTAWTALKRGMGLSHGTRGRILILYILGLVLNWMLTWPASILVLLAVTLIPSFQGQKHAQAYGMIMMFTLYGSYFAVKALIKPIYGIALTIFYFDQRMRKEGFDIEWLMQEVGMVSAPEPLPQPADLSPLPGVGGDADLVVPNPAELAKQLPAQAQDLAGTAGLAATPEFQTPELSRTAELAVAPGLAATAGLPVTPGLAGTPGLGVTPGDVKA